MIQGTIARGITAGMLIGWLAGVGGCQLFVADADREVYKLISERQQAALGQRTDATIDRETVPRRIGRDAYSFVPNPVDPGVPASFRSTTDRPAKLEDYEVTNEESSDSAVDESEPTTQPATQRAAKTLQELGEELTAEEKLPMTLSDALRYAQRYSRQYQTAKEDLYLAALALTLERYLWSPRFMGQISTQYANFGEVRAFDHAMDVVSEVAVEQRLPYGGEVTARVINTLMRDLTNHVTTGETGAAILEANIPLLRGAGRVAYETRYQAERDLIYAVRQFEQFRRDFLVDVASDYFDLLQEKQTVVNAEASYRQAREGWVRAEALSHEEFITVLQSSRAKNLERTALTTLINRRENYQFSLDRFKIRLGLPMTVQLEVIEDESELDLKAPTVGEAKAIETSLRYRLDLLTVQDRIGDAARGAKVAENNLLPDLNFRTSMTSQTDPAHFNSLDIRYDRTTWRAFVDLELPLDRKAERNAFRSSLIDLRRAERAYQQLEDTVKLEVRRALRTIDQASIQLQIQELSVEENELRLQVAQFRFKEGQIENRDVVDAIEDLRDARDAVARALAAYRASILAFRRDTGTLRVGEDGKWLPIEAAPLDESEGGRYNQNE